MILLLFHEVLVLFLPLVLGTLLLSVFGHVGFDILGVSVQRHIAMVLDQALELQRLLLGLLFHF